MSSYVCSWAIKRVEFKFEQFLSTTNQIGTYTLDLTITQRPSWLIIPIWCIWFELQLSILWSWFRRLCSYLNLGYWFNYPQNKQNARIVTKLIFCYAYSCFSSLAVNTESTNLTNERQYYNYGSSCIMAHHYN